MPVWRKELYVSVGNQRKRGGVGLIRPIRRMGKKLHKGQRQIVHWWQHVRYGEKGEQLKVDESITNHEQITIVLSGFASLEAVVRDSSNES